MNLLFNIFHQDNLYEVIVKSNIVTRITKYCGSSQLPREISFHNLPYEVKQQIVDQFRTKHHDAHQESDSI